MKVVVRFLAALLGVTLLLGAAACPQSESGPEPEAWITIGSARVGVEMADTPAKQEKGLGERDHLAWDRGMYFPYERARFPTFWMKGMRFSIDIIWIRDQRIIDLHRNVPFEPGGNGPTVSPRELANAVLEVPAGYAAAKGWRIGDRVRLESTASPN